MLVSQKRVKVHLCELKTQSAVAEKTPIDQYYATLQSISEVGGVHKEGGYKR